MAKLKTCVFRIHWNFLYGKKPRQVAVWKDKFLVALTTKQHVFLIKHTHTYSHITWHTPTYIVIINLTHTINSNTNISRFHLSTTAEGTIYSRTYFITYELRRIYNWFVCGMVGFVFRAMWGWLCNLQGAHWIYFGAYGKAQTLEETTENYQMDRRVVTQDD